MAEGGFDLRQNFNFSDSDSEGEEDRMARELRERLFVFELEGELSPDRKDSLEVGSQSTQNRDNEAETTTNRDVLSSATESSSQSSSCPVLYDIPVSRGRSRTFSFGRLVRRLNRNRRRTDDRTDDGYQQIEIGSGGRGRMQAAGLEAPHSSSHSITQNEATRNTPDGSRIRQRPHSVIMRPRTNTDSNDRPSRRRPNSFLERARRLFDSSAENARESQSSTSSTGSSSMNNSALMLDPDNPTITFPIRVNELVAIRRERARLRVEQTRIEYHIIPDILEITNCPWYWGKINRFEAERVLEGQADGTFLLRDSAQHHYLFSVSFRRYFRTYHARIEQWKHKYSFDKPSDFSYCSRNVCDLLEHYSQAEQCMYYEPLLLHSFPRKTALPLQQLCRAVICNQTTFQGVEELPLPKSLKLYLREYHYKVAVKKMEDKGTQTIPSRKIFGMCRN